MSHTPEPWATEQFGIIYSEHPEWRVPWAINVRDTRRAYPDELEVANARRIVAAINVCQGVSTEMLEASDHGCVGAILRETINSSRERDTYRDLCGELLEALSNYYWKGNSGHNPYTEQLIAKSRAVMGENSNG